jgi:NAD-specific glutamate dehydrogenase
MYHIARVFQQYHGCRGKSRRQSIRRDSLAGNEMTMTHSMFYHEDADILEVFFEEGEATASVDLTADIILHFCVEDRQATSLIFNNYSRLAHQAEYGPLAFHLTVDRWPEPLRPLVWQILTKPPVNEWLAVSTYRSPRMRHAIPLAAVRDAGIQMA